LSYYHHTIVNYTYNSAAMTRRFYHWPACKRCRASDCGQGYYHRV